MDSKEWSGIKRWFSAFDDLKSYQIPSGDELSWLTVSSVFLKMFSGNGTEVNPGVKAKIVMAERAAEEAVEVVRGKAGRGWKREKFFRLLGGGVSEKRIEAATKVISNHEAVVNDACSSTTTPKSQDTLERLSPNSKKR
ncbi:hypothetical protein TL16_g00954 [Triparma laevis f. inornata]|uniref:Uncharacterized protein n=1 Tax=Triparma laevis f. inornata TaxID=1714386 RepID=A0A9W6ZBI2_9STRA|nr:hypothetical protein TL16_g00954 [Triparma laevis f. inornata]